MPDHGPVWRIVQRHVRIDIQYNLYVQSLQQTAETELMAHSLNSVTHNMHVITPGTSLLANLINSWI